MDIARVNDVLSRAANHLLIEENEILSEEPDEQEEAQEPKQDDKGGKNG